MSDRQLDAEINLRGVVGVGIVLIAVTAIVVALMWWMSLGLRSHVSADDPAPAALPEARSQQVPAGPLLQSDPIGELEAMRREEAATLDHAALVDESTATVRLPIDTALEIVAAEGELPTLDQPAAGDAGDGS